MSLEVAVDENGGLLTCDEWPPLKNDHGKQLPELVPVACQQVMTKLSATPPVDPSGKKVRSAQNVSRALHRWSLKAGARKGSGLDGTFEWKPAIRSRAYRR